ncbi:hypothetical protein CCMA1212_001071 [Trichoderma ghanense]|uniref:DUF6546 domain-containing protein n=1 Tax=Trichoderma ghanense TaxID=65468 RepID=A0ABY2HGJ2_9HYPO
MQNGATWSGLPWEIRRSILMEVVRDKEPGWASLASVCMEWQSVIETENLRRINLENETIGHLKKNITQKRRDRVEHIRLNISLLIYDCDLCREQEDLMELGVNTGLVVGCLYKLLRILSSWPRRPSGRGIKLELNAYSESDSMHWYRHYYYGAPSETIKSYLGLHDPWHGWTAGERTQTALPDYIWRIYSFVRGVARYETPPAPVVTSFVIRRTFRRWLQLDIDTPQTEIRKLVIFENISDELSVALNEIPGYDNFQEQVMPTIAGAFAWASTAYQHVWVSLLFDAKVFFSYCYETYNWWHLQSLCLTSSVLNSESPAEAAALIYDAATVAMRMPLLHTLVLWNGEEQGQACAFIYRKPETGPSITWRGTWDIGLYLTSEIVKAWKVVVWQTGWGDLAVCFERVEEEIRFLGDAIYYLRLPCQVIEPQSLWEMRREERTIAPSSLDEVE